MRKARNYDVATVQAIMRARVDPDFKLGELSMKKARELANRIASERHKLEHTRHLTREEREQYQVPWKSKTLSDVSVQMQCQLDIMRRDLELSREGRKGLERRINDGRRKFGRLTRTTHRLLTQFKKELTEPLLSDAIDDLEKLEEKIRIGLLAVHPLPGKAGRPSIEMKYRFSPALDVIRIFIAMDCSPTKAVEEAIDVLQHNEFEADFAELEALYENSKRAA